MAKISSRPSSFAVIRRQLRKIRTCCLLARETQTLLDAFVLEKALYELQYELNNRPHGYTSRIAGILRCASDRHRIRLSRPFDRSPFLGHAAFPVHYGNYEFSSRTLTRRQFPRKRVCLFLSLRWRRSRSTNIFATLTALFPAEGLLIATPNDTSGTTYPGLRVISTQATNAIWPSGGD